MSILVLRKFTPLGFETSTITTTKITVAISVNLPRWGLKHRNIDDNVANSARKFTPLGFETTQSKVRSLAARA